MHYTAPCSTKLTCWVLKICPLDRGTYLYCFIIVGLLTVWRLPVLWDIFDVAWNDTIWYDYSDTAICLFYLLLPCFYDWFDYKDLVACLWSVPLTFTVLDMNWIDLIWIDFSNIAICMFYWLTLFDMIDLVIVTWTPAIYNWLLHCLIARRCYRLDSPETSSPASHLSVPLTVTLLSFFTHGDNLFLQVETTAPPPRRSFRRKKKVPARCVHINAWLRKLRTRLNFIYSVDFSIHYIAINDLWLSTMSIELWLYRVQCNTK